MPLDTLLETGLFAQNSDGSVFPTMVSMQEQLVAQEFAREINSGRLSIGDAYRHFWSYEEDAELWDLPRGTEWRALLPGWAGMLKIIIPSISRGSQMQLADILKGICLKAERHANHWFVFETEENLVSCIEERRMPEFYPENERYSFTRMFNGVEEYDPNFFEGKGTGFFEQEFHETFGSWKEPVAENFGIA